MTSNKGAEGIKEVGSDDGDKAMDSPGIEREFQKLKKDVEKAQSDIDSLEAKGNERHQNVQKDIEILYRKLDDMSTTGGPSSTPSGLVGLAIEDGIRYLLNQRVNGIGWGSRQNAEAVMALRLADPERFSVGKSPINYGFIQGVNDMFIELISELNRPDFENDEFWAHGKLAQYMVGLISACEDTQSFYGFDVASIVRRQFIKFSSFFQNQRFALSWVVLALFNPNLTEETAVMDILIANPGVYTSGIDEASMVVMALSCFNNTSCTAAQRAAEEFILNGIEQDGSFGNEYTTGVAIQALTRYSGSRKDIDDIIQRAQDWLARKVIGKFANVAMANQVLPALAGRSYVDIRDLPCHRKPNKAPTPSASGQKIQVQITVKDNLISETPFDMSWLAYGNEGESMFDVMLKLKEQDPSFDFTSTTHSVGESISSIVGIATGPGQYWKFLGYPDTVMLTGVSDTYPINMDHYMFKVATY
ncbi:hypothetical protein FSP39_017135 [Pinctada imbricata]|uniref:Uncharacterized protein n=1 Tax=Pinctada imbricata TaxID=66713 RepID=A0AA88YNV8_PINIB|nr:hypothetical protein FSP39_017135 [Pinctada imbricata]